MSITSFWEKVLAINKDKSISFDKFSAADIVSDDTYVGDTVIFAWGIK